MGMVIAGAVIGVLLFFGLAIAKRGRQTPDAYEPKTAEAHKVPEFEAELEYADPEGHHTRRLVTVRTVYTSRGYATHIKGYCHSRHQERTFRVDRIESMKIKGEAVQPRTYLAKMMSAANS